MINFCTLFDSAYLTRGLVMYESIKENSEAFHLYIFAFDTLSYKILIELKLDYTTIISLKEFENKDLLEIKDSRTRAEYCWTCTSSVIDFILKKYDVPSCTYLDSDIFFYNSPKVLLNELSGEKTVLITEHRFSKFAKITEQKRAGRFCVQFITFTNTNDSLKILHKWMSQCIDWCYARYEDGKFGDQKYLDTWPEDYSNVHILENPGGGVAPWNVGQYRFLKNGNKILGISSDKKTKFEVVFFHFHYIRILSSGYADLGWNRLGNNVIGLFYKPYIQRISTKEMTLEKLFPEYKTRYYSGKALGTRENIKKYFKKFTKFNLILLPTGNYGIYDRS